MQPVAELRRDLVLVGGGHSHVLALRVLAMKPIVGLRITLVSPSSHTPYSGMLPGLIAGHYQFQQAHIDLSRLCQWAGVRFIAAEVTALDPRSRRLTLAGRPAIEYDVVSIDIGSHPDLDSVPGARAYATPVKPVAGLWQRWQVLHERLLSPGAGERSRVAVVGGGAGSVELALALSHRLTANPVQIDLYCATAEILENYNPHARRAVMAALQRRGVILHCNARVTAVEQSALVLDNDARAAYDELFWCTGAAAAPWIAASGLATDEHGFLAVRDTLQSLDDDSVFGAGDIASQVNYLRPKAGVYAVRQAPVLAHNLRAVLLHKRLREYRPQQRFLSLISLGDKCATADKGSFSATGQWVWRWKDRIDRTFMARFEDLSASMQLAAKHSLPELDNTIAQAVCGGCGAKVGADTLAGALARLSLDYPQHCVGDGDDATVLPAPAGMLVVQSLDVLRQMVADPWQMGRIAANHAFSDLYACGARPVSALAAVTLPYASNTMLERELYQLLAGALHEFAAVDCQLRGGHSMQGPELNFGLVVNGRLMDEGETLLKKTGAAVGDQLVLTKPLGTGVLFAAHMQLVADGRDISEVIAVMLQGNRAAAALALEYGATACTDITGFGLAGHLLEMLSGGLGARLTVAKLPLLSGVIQALGVGIESTMHVANVRSTEGLLHTAEPVDHTELQVVFDPQTSGGLLISLPPERATSLCEALVTAGYEHACVIGEVTARADDALSIVDMV